MEKFCQDFRRSSLFESLSDDDWQIVSSHFPPCEVIPAGEPLLNKDKAALILLVKGCATVHSAGHGRAAVMRKLNAGDIFGVSTLFGDTSPVSEVSAATDCWVIMLTREIVMRCLCESFAFTQAYIHFLTDRIRFLNRRIANYTEDSTEECVLYYIREHLTADGEFSPPGSMTELAKILHVGRSSLYRAFEHLTEQGHLVEIGAKRWKFKEEIV